MLKKVWESRLSDSGFVSVETPSNTLKVFEADKFAELSRLQYQATATYYQNALKHSHNYRFKNSVEKNIWALHASGKGIRSISDQLLITTHQVAQIVERHRKILRENIAPKVLPFKRR